MESHYEINVSHDGQHFFATSSRSCKNVYDTFRVASEIIKRFPEADGYKITMTHKTIKGHEVVLDDVKAELMTKWHANES